MNKPSAELVSEKRKHSSSLRRERLLQDSGGGCFYCKTPLVFWQVIVEHKTPLSRGGTNKYENLAAACWSCDSKKGSMTAEEFMAAAPKPRPLKWTYRASTPSGIPWWMY